MAECDNGYDRVEAGYLDPMSWCDCVKIATPCDWARGYSRGCPHVLRSAGDFLVVARTSLAVSTGQQHRRS